MKKLFYLSIMVLIVLQPVLAQKKADLSKIFLQAGAGETNNNGHSLQLGIRAVINNHWTFTLTFMHNESEAQVPGDYIGYLNTGWFANNRERRPIANTDFYYISAGRFFPLSRSLYFTLDAGLGMAKGQQFTFTRRIGSAYAGQEDSYSPIYRVNSTDRTAFGGVIRTGIDWAFTGVAGIGVDAYYNYNTGGINDNLGYNVKLILGWINRGPKKKKQ